MRVGAGLEKIREHARQHGLAKTAHRLSYAVLKHSVHYLNMRCIWAAEKEIRTLTADESGRVERYTTQFLGREEALRIAGREECRRAGMTAEFAENAMDEGHECLAVMDGDFVAHFSWYSRKSPTRINDDWTLHFDERSVYVYFVYTDPAYRGQKLLPFAVKKAVANSGAEKALAFVESANYSSLKSFYGMGFRDFAHIQVARVLGKPLLRHGAGWERFGFRVAQNIRWEGAKGAAATSVGS